MKSLAGIKWKLVRTEQRFKQLDSRIVAVLIIGFLPGGVAGIQILGWRNLLLN